MEAVEARCVQELIGYYRLSGRTTFTFQNYRGIRLETFYRRKIKFRSSGLPFFLTIQDETGWSETVCACVCVSVRVKDLK